MTENGRNNARLRNFGCRTRGAAVALVAAFCIVAIPSRSALGGDILRGGATRANDAARARELAGVAQGQALKLRANAQDRLARTTLSLQKLQAAQAAARAAAASPGNLGINPLTGARLPDVPDGLGVGALDLDRVVSGANNPVQSGNRVTVKQNESQALLHWRTFNVGRNTTLNFDQSAGGADAAEWIAFNKVTGADVAPSQILGRINAQGQVYVLNQNGIIFGGSSQINTRGLVASSLPLNESFISRGLLIHPSSQGSYFPEFQFSGVADGTFVPPAPPAGRYGDVVVQRGAVLTASVNAEGGGGRVTLVGANVRNEGSIETPSGQTILAAGLQVGFQGHSSSDPGLRGLDVFVGKVDGNSGSAANTGMVDVGTGNLTMAGRSVAQDGVAVGLTSVTLNGRIDLDASYDAVANSVYNPVDAPNEPAFLARKTGSVSLGSGSTTIVMPDLLSAATTVGTALPLSSQINIRGGDIRFGAGSVVRAPGGKIDVKAGDWREVVESLDGNNNTIYRRGEPHFVYSKGSIAVGAGALLDVAGTTDVFVPLAQSILDIELRGSELAVSPLQRDGPIRGETLTVDLRDTGYHLGRYWVGTPLGDATGFANIIERNAAQLSAAGGSISLRAGGSVVTESGSVLDVSGGYYRYAGGKVQTSRLWQGQRLVPADKAVPGVSYSGIYSPYSATKSAKWGVTKTYRNALDLTGAYNDAEHIAGAPGGSLSITAPVMSLEGSLLGQTANGPRQMRDGQLASNLAPPSRLRLDFTSQSPAAFTGVVYPTISPFPVSVVLGRRGGAPLSVAGGAAFFASDFAAQTGFGDIEIENSEGEYEVPEGETFALPAGGSLTANGRNFRIGGTITGPGAEVALTAYAFSPYRAAILKADPASVSPAFDRSDGSIVLGPSAVIDTAGLVVDDANWKPGSGIRPMVLDGGRVSLHGFNVAVPEGSRIDVSGGLAYGVRGGYRYGDGGTIALSAGNDPGLNSLLGGRLKLGGELSGYSGTLGGTLEIAAPLVQIGGAPLHPSSLVLSPEFFSTGGFNRFELTGVGVLPTLAELGSLRAETGSALAPDFFHPAVYVAPGTVVQPVVTSAVYAPPAMTRAGAATLRRAVLSSSLLREPVSVALNAPGIKEDFNGIDAVTGLSKNAGDLKIRGDIVLGTGSVLAVEPGGSVSLHGQTVSVYGTVAAPGGEIEVAGASAFPSLDLDPHFARTTVYLAPSARLTAAGVAVSRVDHLGRRRGTVYPGGSISVQGNIYAAVGSVLDVSGASGELDLTPAELGLLADRAVPASAGVNATPWGRRATPAVIESDGGSLALAGKEMLVNEATMLGRPGGPSAAGGTLEVSSGRFYDSSDPADANPTSADANLQVTQQRRLAVSGTARMGAGFAVFDASGSPLKGSGFFSVDQMEAGGFASLKLGGNPEFVGDVSLVLPSSLSVGSGGVIRANANVLLAAPYVQLGQAFVPPKLPEDENILFTKSDPADPEYTFAPNTGPGSVVVRADFIDVGNLSLENIGRIELRAPGGEIRGGGTMQIAGDMTLEAATIYPVTATTFGLFAYDHGGAPGRITILGSGRAPAPFSAGGSIVVQASEIQQSGVLHAPFGRIVIGWDGTGVAPVNPIAQSSIAVPVTRSLQLGPGSITSVAGLDPFTGAPMSVPYGVSFDGLSWIDPSGQNITDGTLLPAKEISLAAGSLQAQAGSVIDIRGGGDLFAFRWIQGNGGPVDLLSSDPQYAGENDYHYGSSPAFAVVPSFGSAIQPYAPFNQSGLAKELNGADGRREAGYVHKSLGEGDRVYLQGGAGLAAGYYTLLPARYALLPGAFMVTPTSGAGAGSYALPDGSALTGGFRLNGFASRAAGSRLHGTWEIVPSSVLSTRAEYEVLAANTFLPARAAALGLSSVARLPQDAGYLRVHGEDYLRIQGNVLAAAAGSGRGAWADISSSADITILDSAASAPGAPAVLEAGRLSGYGIESLLIGGRRTGEKLELLTDRITLANSLATLTGPDVILAARESLAVAPGASLAASGRVTGTTKNLEVTGDGAAARVSSSDAIRLDRRAVSTATSTALLAVGAGAAVSGRAVTLDSSDGFTLDPAARIGGASLAFGAGQIAIQLAGPAPLSGQLNPLVPQLVLTASQLAGQEAGGRLSLRAHSGPVDLYGPGTLGSPGLGALEFEASTLRGFGQGAGTTAVSAGRIVFANPNNLAAAAPSGAAEGSLRMDAGLIESSGGSVSVSQFASGTFSAAGGLYFSGEGALSFGGDLTVSAPALAAAQGAAQSLSASGQLAINDSGGAPDVSSGLGASLALRGSGVAVNADIALPSGQLTVAATGAGGDVVVGGRLDVSGTVEDFFDVRRYSDGGELRLSAAAGDVSILPGATLAVGAPADGGNAGLLAISSPQGIFLNSGSLEGPGGASISLDASGIPDFTALTALLNTGGFTGSRDFRVRAGDVTVSGSTRASSYRLSLDGGSITVDGTIDVSGATGGSIDLLASGSVVLAAGSLLDASAASFDNAGKGGSVSLEAGSAVGGAADTSAAITIAGGSTIDLRVDEYVAGGVTAPGSSAFNGQFRGTLHLRAPRTGAGAGTGIGIGEIRGDILGASSILAEGFKIYRAPTGTITAAIQSQINSEASSYLGAAGTASANYNAMIGSILASRPGLADVFVLAPGAEIVSTSAAGDLVLGTISSTSTSDWNLSAFRYGPKSAPGVLTLRAPRDIILYNAISDGFTPTAASSNGSWLWLAPLSPMATALPFNTQSWSYRFAAGADMGAADYREVVPAGSIAAGHGGSLRLGKNYGNSVFSSGANALTSTAVNNRFQVIRTGTGDIDISASGDVVLLNQFASIYTAGARLADYATIYGAGDFALPTILDSGSQGSGLGAAQRTASTPSYVQYSMAGGDVRLAAAGDMRRATVLNGVEVDDSSRELPSNWLYRRGYVDPVTGEYGPGGYRSGPFDRFPDPASTTWWVDFSNFFAGVGALGGGNVLMESGGDIRNFDAAIPTSARTPRGMADASLLHETGGGDLVVRAGGDLDAGVYYVERGDGTLQARGSITTNPTRSPLNTSASPDSDTDPLTWLPTTLFLGKGGFDVSALGDILLGPVANAFLLPPGINNRYWNKSYFSTYAPDSRVTVTSLGGGITHRTEAQLPLQGSPRPLLSLWAESHQLLGNTSSAWYQPWLRLSETSIPPFEPLLSLAPPSLLLTAFSGDISLAGDLTLFPSSRGTIELVASGAINGLQPVGHSQFAVPGQLTRVWQSSTVNLSDTDPSKLPGVANPLSATAVVGRVATLLQTTAPSIFTGVLNAFAETGSYSGANASAVVQEMLHAPGPLHSGDAEPARLYAGAGNIEGLTFFSAKSARLFAGLDVADVALYLQNVNDDDASIVTSGRDILPYSASGPLRSLSSLAGNAALSGPLAGDIQISGPGYLDVLAGRDIDLGTGENNADGTATGITAIGNLRNPFLGFTGAEITMAAGFGPSTGLGSGAMDVDAFLDEYGEDVDPELDADGRARLALRTLFRVLAESASNSSATGYYSEAIAAVDLLFGGVSFSGDISTYSREVKTRTGGALTMLAPGGAIRMASSIIGQPLVPPGIVTEFGGSVSILTDGDVDIGKGRIFTLRGGDITIWSSSGDIAAGTTAKTVVTAPPTRVAIDVRTGEVQTDLGGLATGGGIGVLASVEGIEPGSVTLLAPEGTVDAGDAGIRATGDITIAAAQVLNADNISAGGTTVGAPAAPVAAAPNIAGLSSASTSTAATSSAAADVAQRGRPDSSAADQEAPSTITVEVLGYGGGEGGESRDREDEEKRASAAADAGSGEPVL